TPATGDGGPRRIVVSRGEIVTRGTDEVVSAVLSLSGSAPHLFGDRLADFQRDLRGLLCDPPPGGRCAARLREVELVLRRRSRRPATTSAGCRGRALRGGQLFSIFRSTYCR